MDFFFFQAEDGIRDLVRSRGLGDVYKRQGEAGPGFHWCRWTPLETPGSEQRSLQVGECSRPPMAAGHQVLVPQKTTIQLGSRNSVSYTHLTLPTSDLV